RATQRTFEYRMQNVEKVMWARTKRRAEKKNRPFTISVSDITIPEVCPVLGISLDCIRDKPWKKSGPRPNSPSIDCIKPELGYVPGNIAVISNKANSIKQNATAVEIRKVAAWLDKYEQI